MRNAFEIFHISSSVVQFYLSIPKQEEFIEKILSCESYREFKEIVPTGKVNWETLRVRLFQFFSAANQSQGKFVSILCSQTIQEMLNDHLIFYEGVLEFKIFTLLHQYLIAKQSMNKEDMKQLFSLVIWKSNLLHIIIRIFMGYLIVVKVSKKTNISKVFNQISKLIGIAITQKNGILYEKDQFKDDCKQLIQLWLKYIEGTSNQEQVSQLKILINQLRKHFKESLLHQDVIVRLEQLLSVSLNLQITNSFQNLNQNQDVSVLKARKIIAVNNYMPVVNKLQIQNIGLRVPSDQSLTASKRIKTNQSQRSLKVKQIENDPIFQVQLENYHIGQMVRKGYFRIKQPVSLSTQTRTIMKSQPSFHNQNNEVQHEQTVIQHEHFEHDSIVEQPPMLNFADLEPKINIKQPSSHLSDKSLKIEKKNSTFNPYKLRNLISSRFQQILDIAQDSESSSPNNQQKQQLMKRQNSHLQKEQQDEFNNFISGGTNGLQIEGRRNSSRRSGVRVSTPEIAIQVSNQLTSDQESLKQSFKQPEIEEQIYFLQPIAVTKRLQRRNVVALKYGNSFFIESTNVYIPKFGFRFIYYKCVCDWRVKLILSQKKVVQLMFYETTFSKITFLFDLIGLSFENINNWGQICQQFIKQLQNIIGSQLSYLNYNQELTQHQYNAQSFLATEFDYELKEDQIKSMGLMKDVFRLLFNTYIFEQKVITGSKLKLCKEKDLTLIAMREIINVLNFYKYSIKKSLVNTNDNKYFLLLNGMGETIKKNIGLINKLFNLRLNICDGKYLLHKQLIKLKDLSIKMEEQDNTFLLVKASLVISNQINQQKYGNQILYYHKNDYKAKPLLEIEFEIDGYSEYQSLRLKFESIEKILEKKYHYSAKHIIDIVLFQQNRFIPRFRDFILQKLMINEQKQLAIRLNIFSLQDAQKLEACGMKLGFLLDLKTKVKPFAITEIERYIHDDTQKKLEYEQTTQEIYKRQHLFDKHFNKIFSDENENQDIERKNKSSLIELVKRYQLNVFENKEENTQKVGPIQIYSDNPFTDQHLDDYEEVKSQFFVRNNFRKYQIIHFRIGRKGFTIKYNGGLETRFHEGKRYQKFSIPYSEEDEQNIQLNCQFIRNAPKLLIEHTLYKKMSVRLLRTSFRNTTLHDGFDMMKQIQSRSTLSEIPTYNVLHFILLNNCNYLLRFFNLKQFVLVQKIKNYGKFQIIIRVFYRFQQTDILTENDYFIMRLDFQDIHKKIGMMKLIFNRYDIVDILRIPIFTHMTDTSIVQTAMDIFHKVHLGIFALQSVPYFLYKPFRNQSQHEDHSTSEKISRIRRINNFPENSSFKKADFCKGFLEHFIQNHRLVLTYIKKLYLITQNNFGQIVRISRTPHNNIAHDQVQNQEFIVFQVFRHLLLDQWILKIYVPRTTRFMATVIKNEDFRNFDQTKDTIGKVLEKISQNSDPIPFKDFEHFSQMICKLKTATQLMRVSTREKSVLVGRKMSNFNLKPLSRDLSDFFYLTNQLSEISEIEKTENNKYSHLEKKIWMNFIDEQINYEPYSKKNTAFLSIIFQDQEFPLQEQLFQRYIRIERIGESHIEFYLKYMQKPLEQLKGFALLKGKLNLLQNNRISGLVQEMKYNEEQVRQLKKTSIFFPFDAISYANTSNYNIELMYFSYNKFTEVREQINLRELLNLYIADGFFKYQTNYMNSKLNLSDVLNICYYIIYKIKNQNFLNLSQYHTIPNLNQLNPRKESHKQAIQQFKCFIKPYFCVIQQYYEEIKITCQHRTTLIEINQMFQIAEIEEQVFGFKQLTTKYPRLALERLSKVLVKLMNINTQINQ